MVAHGRLKYTDMTMAKLARVFGSDAKAKVLFLASTKQIDPALLGSDGAASPVPGHWYRHDLSGHSAGG